MPDLVRGVVPPGPYAKGARSPIVWVLLCPVCAGYAPMTDPDYSGFLSGQCQGCGSCCRELHRFSALIASADGCNCTGQHDRVRGDLFGKPGVGEPQTLGEALGLSEEQETARLRGLDRDFAAIRDAER
jgi:hypothetical protein